MSKHTSIDSEVESHCKARHKITYHNTTLLSTIPPGQKQHITPPHHRRLYLRVKIVLHDLAHERTLARVHGLGAQRVHRIPVLLDHARRRVGHLAGVVDHGEALGALANLNGE